MLRDMLEDFKEYYFRPKAFENRQDGKVYEKLGVRFYKKYVPTGGNYFKERINFRPITNAASKEKGLEWLLSFTRSAEFVHVLLFAFTFVVSVSALFRGEFRGAFVSTLINLIVNIYPIMLQRYNRVKIIKVLANIKSKRIIGSNPLSTI